MSEKSVQAMAMIGQYIEEHQPERVRIRCSWPVYRLIETSLLSSHNGVPIVLELDNRFPPDELTISNEDWPPQDE